MIIAVSGTPGTGKTEAARALAGLLGWKLVALNDLASRKGLYSGYDRERKCKIVDISSIAREVEKLSGENNSMIVESHYAHDMPCDVAVILRTRPDELRKRLVKKRWLHRKIEENVEAEIMEICKSEALEQGRKVIEIDTTGKRPGQTAEEIARKTRQLI